MKKSLGGILLLFVLTLYIICTNEYLMKEVTDLKFSGNNFLLSSIKYKYGDLYGISYLSKFKIPFPDYQIKKVENAKKRIDLYILGDSYLAGKIHTSNFLNVDTLYFADWRGGSTQYKLDSSKEKILIIETSERAFVNRFLDNTKMKYVFSNLPLSNKGKSSHNSISNLFFNKKINENLEFVIFDNELFSTFKQWRADISYKYFNTLSANVAISNDGHYLFLKETIDTNLNSSSFRTIQPEKLHQCIINCRDYIEFYKSQGFNQVLISVIPNPVTILGYKNYEYNNLIARIQFSPERTFKTVDVYSDFLHSKLQLYHFSDSHWNTNGLQIWVDNVNKVLMNEFHE